MKGPRPTLPGDQLRSGNSGQYLHSENGRTTSQSIVQMPVRFGNVEENRPYHLAGARRPADFSRRHSPSKQHRMACGRSRRRDHDLIRIAGDQVREDAHSDSEQPRRRMCRCCFQRQPQNHHLPLPQQAQRFLHLLGSAFSAHDAHLDLRQVHPAVVAPTFIVPSRWVAMQGFSLRPLFVWVRDSIGGSFRTPSVNEWALDPATALRSGPF